MPSATARGVEGAGFAGQIRLWFVPKYLEVYDTINALLNEVE